MSGWMDVYECVFGYGENRGLNLRPHRDRSLQYGGPDSGSKLYVETAQRIEKALNKAFRVAKHGSAEV
jgi:hypothetical protein